MPQVHSSPYKQMDNPATLLNSLLRQTKNNKNFATTNGSSSNANSTRKAKSKGRGSSGGILRMFKLLPLLTSGCKMVALLAAGSNRPRRSFIADHATICTIFGHRRGRVTLAIQEDPHSQPIFILELPILSSAFHKEMSSDILRIALESETKTKKKVMDEYVWAVYCNGRKIGYSIRRKHMTDDEIHVMQVLKGVSMGAGVVPCATTSSAKSSNASVASTKYDEDDEYYKFNDQRKRMDTGFINAVPGDGESFTYLRARFERVVGSKDSEALYMINPDHSDGPEMSIFFIRLC